MNNNSPSQKSLDFEKSYEHICNWIAVSQVGDYKTAVDGLIKLCIHHFGDVLSTPADFIQHIEILFSIAIREEIVRDALQRLEREKTIQKGPQGFYVLAPGQVSRLEKEVNRASELETEVRDSWIEEIEELDVGLEPQNMWHVLNKYMASVFCEHGMQAIQLMNPEFVNHDRHARSLKQILNQEIANKFPPPLHDIAARILSKFFDDIPDRPNRARYIAQLADGAFNYFLMASPPETANAFQNHSGVTRVFIDTNFLMCLMGLNQDRTVKSVQDLVKSIRKNRLPFKIHCHEETIHELTGTIHFYGKRLLGRQWSASLSEAALEECLEDLSSIEQTFHELNKKAKISPEDFVSRFSRPETLLEDYGIKIYRPVANEQIGDECVVSKRLKAFIDNTSSKIKSNEAIRHDSTLLRQAVGIHSHKFQRSPGQRTLLLTLDTALVRFDQSQIAPDIGSSIVVRPATLWQVVRPMLPISSDYVSAFASAFSIPEFRTFGGRGDEACSEMLRQLALYDDLPKESAVRMLADEALRKAVADSPDSEKDAIIQSAIVDRNRELEADLLAFKSRDAQTQIKILELQKTVSEIDRRSDDHRKQNYDLRTHLQSSETDKSAMAKDLADLQRRMYATEAEAAVQRLADADKQKEIEKLERSDFRNRWIAGIVLAASVTVLSWQVGFEYLDRLTGWPHNVAQKLLYVLVIWLTISMYPSRHKKEILITAIAVLAAAFALYVKS